MLIRIHISFQLALIDLGVPLGARLAILIVGGVLVYLAVMVVAAPQLVRDAREGLLRRRMATAWSGRSLLSG